MLAMLLPFMPPNKPTAGLLGELPGQGLSLASGNTQKNLIAYFPSFPRLNVIAAPPASVAPLPLLGDNSWNYYSLLTRFMAIS